MSSMYGTAIDQAPKAAARLPITPARRAALLFGVPLCLLVTAIAGFSLVARIGTGWTSLSYQVPGGASRVTVTTSGGDVVLRQAAAASGSLTGTGYYSLVRPHITRGFTAGRAYFGYRCALGFVNCGLNATLSVPRGTAVSVSTDGGNVTASGTSGDITLSTGGGDVTASGLAGDLSASTGGGNIDASAITALRLTADSGGGDITITFTAVPRDVQVSTGGGDITIVVPPGDARYRISATTAGGNVHTLPDDPSATNLITAASGGGDITIKQAP